MASPSSRAGETRYNYMLNVVRAAKTFRDNREERLGLMDEQHRMVVLDLEAQLVQLSRENQELRGKLKLQPENFYEALTEDARRIADLERKLMKSTIENEQIRHALLLQPDHFCWAGREVLQELRSLIADVRLDLQDYADSDVNLDVSALQLERLDKSLAQKNQSLTALKTSLATRTQMHREEEVDAEWMQVLSDINRSLARKDVELQLQEKEHYKKEMELSQRREELKEAIKAVENQAQSFLEDKERTTQDLAAQRESLEQLAARNEDAHKKRMDDFEGTLAEAISNQMRDRDESIAQKSAKVQQQKRELALHEKEISKLTKKIAEHEHELVNRQEALEESKVAAEKLSQELEEVNTDLSNLKGLTTREAGEREADRQRKQKEEARTKREAEVADKKAEQQHQREQKAMKLNMAHKFPDPEEGLEFKVDKITAVPAMADDPSQWPGQTGMIIDVKGIHVYNRAHHTAFSLSYGHIHHWTGGPSGGPNQWAKAPKEATEGGTLSIYLRRKPSGPPTQCMIVQSEAAKSIHNYLCIMFDKWGNMVRTRAKWEIEEDEKAKKAKGR